MKKWMCLVLGLCMMVTMLAACGEDDDKTSSLASTASNSSAVTPVITPSPTPEQTAKAVKVKATDGLNIRSKGSTSGDILGLAEDGSKLALLVEDKQDGWYQVSYKGKAAYVSAEYVDVVEVSLDEYNKLKAEAGKDDDDDSSGESGDKDASSKSDDDDSSKSGGDDEDGE